MARFYANYSRVNQEIDIGLVDVESSSRDKHFVVYVDGEEEKTFHNVSSFGCSIDVSRYRKETVQISVFAWGSGWSCYLKSVDGGTVSTVRIDNVRKLSWVKLYYDIDRRRLNCRGNGKGSARIYSVTRNRYIGDVSFSREDDEDTLRFSDSEIGDFIGRGSDSYPIGTVVAKINGDYASNYVYVLRNNFDFECYDGRYTTDINLKYFRAKSFYRLTKDWERLINIFNYIGNAEGYFRGKSFDYSEFYPSRGNILTASKYNELIELAQVAMANLDLWTRTPSRVSSQERIREDFICGSFQKFVNEAFEKMVYLGNQGR